MRTFLGLACIIAAIVLGVYVGVWLMFIGGVVGLIETLKVSPINSLGVAVSMAKILLSGLTGWATFAILSAIGAGFLSD